MAVAEKHSSSGYALGPPWMFKGSALYQLHLVKSEIARAFIPKDLKLVEAFGYTLGGFFLAHYEDSPAGMFNEVRHINLTCGDCRHCMEPPDFLRVRLYLFCGDNILEKKGWAARVLVNSDEACRHGQKEIGLPSHVGLFSKRATEIIDKPTNTSHGFLGMMGMASNCRKPKEQTEIQVSEINGSSLMSLCNISLPFVVPKSESVNNWMGPRIRMLLPSFSGQTIHNPHLLKYSCQIECRVRAVETAKVLGPTKIDSDKSFNDLECSDKNPDTSISPKDDSWDQSISVLLSKPILALEFNLLKMQVDMPSIVFPQPTKNMSGRSEN